MIKVYFDFAYNPLYDLIIATLSRYQELQRRSVDKLVLKDDDRILCAGLGTGNEIHHILQTNKNVNIVGIDFSKTALKRASKKALSCGKEIDVLLMDVRHLEFADGSFDKILCLHVMDFTNNCLEVTNELIRVLKNGGRFAITFPSEKEGVKLGFNLLKDSINRNEDFKKNRMKVISNWLVRILLGLVYLPLLMRPGRKSYSRSELEAVLDQSKIGDYQIEEDKVYQDFLVYGTK
jgi:ubiquinone/menaquinone biosynthesis C-methylase UbiE